jgi:hypothetical protein
MKTTKSTTKKSAKSATPAEAKAVKKLAKAGGLKALAAGDASAEAAAKEVVAAAAKAKPAKKAAKAKPAKPAAKKTGKGATILALIARKGGATATELQEATGWQAHSVRGFLSTATKKGLAKITSAKRDDGQRVYSA